MLTLLSKWITHTKYKRHRCKYNLLYAAVFRSKPIKYSYEQNTQRNKKIKKIYLHFGKSSVVFFVCNLARPLLICSELKKWMNGYNCRLWAPKGWQSWERFVFHVDLTFLISFFSHHISISSKRLDKRHSQNYLNQLWRLIS